MAASGAYAVRSNQLCLHACPTTRPTAFAVLGDALDRTDVET